MKRRDVIKALAAGSAVGLAGCRRNGEEGAPGVVTSRTQRYNWRMYTTWPRNFPALGTGANRLAEMITNMSDGRLNVTVFGAGDRVPAFEVFGAVARGSAQMGHGAAYYWKGQSETAPLFSGVPFGLTAQEMNGWLHFGGGMALWRELYARFGVVPFDAGNTGAQWGGWFRKKINSMADLRGLKMRIPGLGGEVMARVGVNVVNIPGGELFTALQSGVIDALEWVGPYNDLAFGLHRAARYFYYPGWQEPGTTLECIVNQAAFEELPADLQAIVEHACAAASHLMLAELTARNGPALRELTTRHGVEVLKFPDEVLETLRQATDAVLEGYAAKDPFTRRVYESYVSYRDTVVHSTRYAESAFLRARERGG